MITEDYVSFEIAKLLKEKGFDSECRAFYVKSKECGIELFNAKEPYNYNNNVHPCTSAPTLQMAVKWIREVYHKYCDVSLDYVLGWYIQIIDTQETAHVYDNEEMKIYHPEQDYGFNSYKEACEAAIKYCLENLI